MKKSWSRKAKRVNAVSYDKYWSENYSNEIDEVNEVAFVEMERKFAELHYLPNGTEQGQQLHSLEHLVYLSAIRKGDKKSPFTYKQQLIFDTNLRYKRQAIFFFAFNAVVIVLTALVTLVNLTQLYTCANTDANGTAADADTCLNYTAAFVVPLLMNLAFIVVLGLVSLYATGVLPNQASIAANRAQDTVRLIHVEFLTLAKYVLDIYFEFPEKSKELVQRFEFEELKRRIEFSIGSSTGIFAPLEEVYHFVVYDRVLLTFTEIENYAYSKLSDKRLSNIEESIRIIAKELKVTLSQSTLDVNGAGDDVRIDNVGKDLEVITSSMLKDRKREGSGKDVKILV